MVTRCEYVHGFIWKKQTMEINLQTDVEFDQHPHGIALCVFRVIIDIAGWSHVKIKL